ncbi:AraC family transcriptional regulator [Pedobacter panaciterrae]|jgi:AraC-type DNA-binding domain-containing proteins|uniref:AraC family transcriptional regulator n=1 Tax=Pedobacter panaciterrae TaxID=363849 RepID=A0ABU8NN59_9SPHI|nr:AraC family transcriptional regulator [Pedobacter panaciterrae]NQX53305.1 AraC family transcriptional regulator [Pedobacter panaciterrae]
MKAQLLKVSMSPAQSFSVRQDVVPSVNNKWHYHPEFELVYFSKGKGTQFIGDNISRFNQGDIVLVGPQLPHYWRFDDMYFRNNNPASNPDVRVVHFSENMWGESFLNLPENKLLKSVLEKSRRGLKIKGKNKQHIADLISEMPNAEGIDRIIILMQVLAEITKCEKLETFSSIGFQHEMEPHEKDRINDIYDYSYANFKNKITLEEIADVAKISPNSFCRYFKSRTRKTYSQFLIEIKVGRACELLIEHSLNLKQVCYDCGFNNFASFYKCFKKITGKSPLCYQKEFVTNFS